MCDPQRPTGNDAQSGYDPHKTLYNPLIRWSRLGVFDCIFAALAGEGSKPERILINTTHLKAHRTAASLLKKGAVPRRIGRTKRGLNSTLHAVGDGEGKPLILLLSEGQMSDHRGARLVVDALPPTSTLIADRGYYSNGFREALLGRASHPASPPGRRHPFRKARCSIVSGTRSRICSQSSRTGGVSPRATIDALIPSSQRSASQPPSSSTSINEP